MLIEIASSLVMGGIFAGSFFAQNITKNDASKIQRIAANCGLLVKEAGMTRTIHLKRRRRLKNGTEYVYRIPLGLAFTDFEKRLDHFQDGINGKSFSLADLADLFKRKQRKPKQRKEIELQYDGMLKIFVYDSPLPDLVPFDDDTLGKLNGWQVPVGEGRNEFVAHDFDQIPHLIVAGTTRYGKSVFLKNVITTLIARQPDAAKFTLIDLKGGLTFNRYKNARQVHTVAKNVSETLEALRTIQAEMNQRMDAFLEAGHEDIKEAGFKERHFIIVDEAAQLASAGHKGEEKNMRVECEQIVAEIARVGGGLGYRIVYATQYPTADTLPRQVKQNCDAKICFKLQTDTASRVVLDEDGAESLPLIKGRAIYLTDRKRIVQTPFIENKYIEEKIGPHIVIKARPDNIEEGTINNGEGNQTATALGSHTLVIEAV
ncbi:FtsK/SpoIIIE domain-containing protein [Pseudobacillus sp. FSL P4-0506]|uniref:FtsK/SpoIIIE domain-containing protein n=1 Tax=Pseudobacillus sp. FSL P4-0506 TaxID=2921576 RepID=UPI0030F8A4AD